MGAGPAGDFDPQISALITMKVRRLIGRHGFTRDDEEDLRQQLWTHVINGMRHHDPRRGSRLTYADRIVSSKIVSIIEYTTAQKRDRRKLRPITDDSALPGRGSSPEQLDLAADIREALSLLPAELRAIATLLMEFTEAEVIRKTGLTRQQVRGMRAKIERHLRAMGLTPGPSD